MVASSDFNRSLSRIFSTPVFKEIACSGTNDYLLVKLKKYDQQLSVSPGMLVKDVLENAYGYLGKNYRNEYVYKNTILNNILLGRHSVRTATMLNEFKIGNSIADTVIINGTSTVYEIKTELDSPDKLQKQLEDYKKAFMKVYLVTHYSVAQKYLALIKESSVGLLSLSGRFNLTTLKEADEDFGSLSNDAMIKAMRKQEYSAVIKEYCGAVPTVPNIKFFSACLEIAASIDTIELHSMFMKQLRKRVPAEAGMLESQELPKELKHVCLSINPNKKQYDNLIEFLNLNL